MGDDQLNNHVSNTRSFCHCFNVSSWCYYIRLTLHFFLLPIRISVVLAVDLQWRKERSATAWYVVCIVNLETGGRDFARILAHHWQLDSSWTADHRGERCCPSRFASIPISFKTKYLLLSSMIILIINCYMKGKKMYKLV